MRRILQAAIVAAIAILPLAFTPSTAAAPAPPSSPDQSHPWIMAEAAAEAAAPAAPNYAPASPATPAARFGARAFAPSSPVTAANTRPRREVLGFVNAGNLGSPTLGYTTWNFSLLSTVVFFGLQVNSGDGAIVQGNMGWNVYHSTTMTNFVNTAHANGTRVLVSINLHDFSTSPTNQVCTGLQSANAQTTINQAIAQMTQAGIDGINIDYEATGPVTCSPDNNTNRADLVSFVQKMRAQMQAQAPGTSLYIDAYTGSAEDNQEFFDITSLSPNVDAFFVMAYDMDYDNATQPPLNCTAYCFNPVSALNTYRFNVTKSIQQYTALVPASQMILGQPYYGRRGCGNQNLTTPHQGILPPPPPPDPRGPGWFASPTYVFASTVQSQGGVVSFTPHRDNYDGVSEWDSWYDTDFQCNRHQYYDDVFSLGAKFDAVNSSGLRGVGVFTLDYAGGAPELWNNFAAHFTCPGFGFLAGDFVGSGNAGLAVLNSAGSCVMASSGAALATPVPWASIPFYGNIATLAGDVTGSGKAALVAVSRNQTFVMPSTGTAFGPPAAWSSVPFYGTRATFLADVNGDGKQDLVAVNDTSVWVMLSTGSGFGAPTLWSNTPFYGNVTTLVGDVNGDGKADLIAINNSSTWIMASTGTAFGAPTLWSNTPFYGNVTTMAADVNGDGKADLVAVNNGSTWIMTSTGSGFNSPALWSNLPFYGQWTTLAADVTGDKKVDLVALNYGSVWVMASTGTAFASPAIWLSGPP